MKTKILSKIFIILTCLTLLAGGFSCAGGGSGGPSAGTGTPLPDGGTPPPDGGGGTPQPPTLPSCKDGYCLIPEAKDFQLGSIDPEADSDEYFIYGGNKKLPPKVMISGFLMGKTEVTVGQYKRFLNTNVLPNDLLAFTQNQKGDDFPIVGLTFNEKRAYCKVDQGDLPTAAQVERAAKGVSGTDKYGTPITQAIIDCGDKDPECQQKFTDTEVVCGSGEKDKEERANSFGVCDLAGNVWESALDKYEEGFYSRIPLKDPYNELTDEKTQLEEFRGGGFDDGRRYARAANRNLDYPYLRVNGTIIRGFRCARPLPQ